MIKLYQGDSFELIKKIEDESIKLVMTDVPYPDLPIKGKLANYEDNVLLGYKKSDEDYTIISSKEWIKWFEPLAKEIVRVLEPGGSFVTTINCKCDFTFYHRFVTWMCDTFNLVYVYEWIWQKSNVIPGRIKHIPRQAFDYIAHFYKGTFEDSKKLYDCDLIDDWNRFTDKNTPSNMIIGKSTITKEYLQAKKDTNINHNGRYCDLIPELFIRLLTDEGDSILEPFNGSSTTSIVAEELGCNCIAFEQNADFNKLACRQYDLLKLNYEFMLGGKK